MRICIITDNKFAYESITELVKQKDFELYDFDFFCSDLSPQWITESNLNVMEIKLKEQNEIFFNQYDLFLSIHAKQIFPANLVNKHRCINIHPGFNPYNRGWYPHAFSIVNSKPAGVTIHEMDSQLDHGKIIYQERVEMKSWDTSGSLYERILKKEKEMLDKYLKDIIEGNYSSEETIVPGNLNTKKNYQELCCIDLKKTATYGEVINLLRATTFPPYDNAYFYDENGEKIYINVQLKKGGCE